METKQRNILLGAAAVVIVGTGGVLTGRSLLAPVESHVGESAAEHARELLGADGPEAEHAGEEHADGEAHESGEEHAAEGEHAEGEVAMEADLIAAAKIELLTLSEGSIGTEIVAQATIAPSPDGEAILTARAAGSISAIRKRVGDPVARGETVATVTSSEAAGIAAEATSAKARYELAKSNFERERSLFEQKVTARQELETAQAALREAEAEYRRSEASARAARVSADGTSVLIASPIAGRVTTVTEAAKLGAYVSPETVLFRIADPQRIQIEAAVPALDAQRIAPGDSVRIESSTGQTIGGQVRSVSPGVDVQSRSATVVISTQDPLAGFQPGQFVRAVIAPKSSAQPAGRFVVPDEAVQSVEGKDVVFVRTEEGFIATPVTRGLRSAGRVEVLSGLSAGQVVATRNAFLLKAELGKGSAEHEH